MNRTKRLGYLKRRYGRLLTLLFLLLVTGLSVGWSREPQAQPGTVLGEVVNGTPGGSVPNDLTVALHIFSEMEETNTYTTTVTGERSLGGGRSFRFEEISFEEGETVVARVAYGGVTYVSEFATVEQDREALSLPVTIYETTQDPADITISQLHLFVNKLGERIQIGAYVVIGNSGNQTYVGSSADGVKTTWSARLPDGAENLQFDSAELASQSNPRGRFASSEGGFADTRPIPPGDANVETSFTYELPFQQGSEIEQAFDVPVRAAVLVLPEGEWGLKGVNISPEGTLDTQMGAALSYTAGPLDADEPLAFAVVPRASSVPEESEGQALTSLTLGITALVIAGAAVALMWRNPSPGRVPAKVRAQVEAISALDRDFESGRLSEQSYREKRRSLKRRLRRKLSGSVAPRPSAGD